jgi:hypothetical protein
MKTLAATMLSVSLAGLCAVGAVSAQTPTPKQCQPARAPPRVEGQVVEMNATQERVKVRDSAGATHEFQASAETLRDLKIGDRIEATLRALPKC